MLRIRLLPLAFLLTAAAASLLGQSPPSQPRPLPLFNATLSLGAEHRFVLVSATGKVSTFLTLGESFDEHRLHAYDPKTGVLVLERDGTRSPVTLVPDAPPTGGADSENRRLLQALAGMLKPQGMIVLGGKGHLMVAGRRLAVGSTFNVTFRQKEYAIELSAVDRTTFTLRFRGEAVASPLKPAAR